MKVYSHDVDTLTNVFLAVVGPAEHGEERAYHACSQSLERLGVGWLDLYLIHWPGVQKLKHDDPRNRQFRKQSWLAMERLYRDGTHSCVLFEALCTRFLILRKGEVSGGFQLHRPSNGGAV